MKKIAIQGIKGCFHHISLINFFGINRYEIIECKSFNQLIQVITNRESHLGIMAIENSIIGSLLPNYIFLSNYNFKIISSIILYIEQNLITYLDKDFNEIVSHTVALQQCDNFISDYTNLKAIKYSDTSLASLYISKNMLKNRAAISSKLSAKEYNLKIRYKNIQNNSNNFTKFFVIEGSQKKIKKNCDKSSIFFCLNTNCYKKFLNFLRIIASKKIIFTKLLVFNDNYGEYIFYIDIINNINYEFFISKIKKISYIFYILGEYINFIN